MNSYIKIKCIHIRVSFSDSKIIIECSLHTRNMASVLEIELKIKSPNPEILSTKLVEEENTFIIE